MKLVVWNSQGNKWDGAWGFLTPLLPSPRTDDVLLFLVESGWPPWVQSGDVVVNQEYDLDTDMMYYDEKSASKSRFCTYIIHSRECKATWIPWVKNFDGVNTNSRCSLGAAFYPSKRTSRLVHGGFTAIKQEEFIRPTIRVQLGKGTEGLNVGISLYVVHMISSAQTKAEAQLITMMKAMQKVIPQGSAALIVGDMNVNLLSAGKMNDLPKNWSILSTGVATQQSGGELDYGLLYDPNSAFGSSSVSVLAQYKTVNNKSDHSALLFDVPIP